MGEMASKLQNIDQLKLKNLQLRKKLDLLSKENKNYVTKIQNLKKQYESKMENIIFQ